MAGMIKSILVFSALLATPPLMAQDNVPKDLDDADAVAAFKEFWSAFDEYERKLINQGRKGFQKSWEALKQDYRKERAKLNATQIAALKKAAQRYKRQLEEHPNSDNKPYVMMNLAQVLNLIGDHLNKDDPNAGTFSKTEALAILREIKENHRNFVEIEQAEYLQAVILETLDRQDDALAVWQSLSRTATRTIYGVHAGIALGDHMFLRERNAEAVAAYKAALALLPNVTVADADYENLRIHYRLAWAAYRAGDLPTVISSSSLLLQPGLSARSAERREKIQQDAADLLGDALYEMNNPGRARDYLGRQEISAFAAAAGLRALNRFYTNRIYNEAAQLGEFLIEKFPLSRESPAIIQVTADAWDKSGKSNKRLMNLEKLAIMLPGNSLWRSRHREDLPAIREMEERARNAAEYAASTHYSTALASGNVKGFQTASSFYDMLISHAPNDDKANTWRLRRGHSQFFAGNLDEAASNYEALKSQYKVDTETLQVAAYQQVLTHERRWREAFAKATEKGDDPYKDSAAVNAVNDLERSIDEFAARFPGQTRATDLLLVGGSVNRDMDRYDRASKYWQRALVSTPTAAQRGVAIRGLIFASVKTGSSADVVNLTRKFLKLEDFKDLGQNVANELKGVLSAATLDEGKRLNQNGSVLEGGLLLTQVAEEFPDLPNRDRVWRDGAYMMAIAGDWAGAQKASEAYFKAGMLKNRADMTYLLARAHEYQLRLRDAAGKYLELGEKFPKHPRAPTSLARAEKLAVAEGAFATAAQAAAVRAEQARDPAERQGHYQRAADYLAKADNADKALAVARRRVRASNTLAEQYKARIQVAEMTYKAGSEQEALDDLAILAKQIDNARGKLPRDDFAQLTGEVNFMLGEEARRKFEDFRIVERGGSMAENVNQKTRYFNDLVTSYDKAVAGGDPTWAAGSRYQIAIAADALADEIASIPNQAGEAVNFKARSRYSSTVDRLRQLARKYHSTNVLEARKNPARYKGNEWVRKSGTYLSGGSSPAQDTKREDVMPTSFSNMTPSDWSL